jgi:hypothetical protein
VRRDITITFTDRSTGHELAMERFNNGFPLRAATVTAPA